MAVGRLHFTSVRGAGRGREEEEGLASLSRPAASRGGVGTEGMLDITRGQGAPSTEWTLSTAPTHAPSRSRD